MTPERDTPPMPADEAQEALAAALRASYGHYDRENEPDVAAVRSEDVIRALRAEGWVLMRADETRVALRSLHERAESFNPAGRPFFGTPAATYGRGTMFPGAHSLDHEIGHNPEGCDGCIAFLAAALPSHFEQENG